MLHNTMGNICNYDLVVLKLLYCSSDMIGERRGERGGGGRC